MSDCICIRVVIRIRIRACIHLRMYNRMVAHTYRFSNIISSIDRSRIRINIRRGNRISDSVHCRCRTINSRL